MPIACPSCSSTAIASGRLMSSGDDGWVTRFYPKGLKFFSFSKSVPIWNGQLFQACLACGHTWSKVDASELRELLQKSGNERTAALLAQIGDK